MIPEFNIINYFLYTAMGIFAVGGGAIALAGNNKICKLANNEVKDYKEALDMMGEDGLKISKNVTLSKKYDLEGVCMIAPTGAGKTTSLFLNNLLENNIRGSYIVTDPKGELFKLTSGYQKKICRRKVYKIDFTNTDYSEQYNLLGNCKNSEEIIQLSNTLLMNGALSVELSTGKKAGGVEWIQMAEPLLASVLIYTSTLSKPFNTIEFALQLILNLNSTQLKKLIDNSKNLDAITQYSIFLSVGGADRTEGSIKITLATNMRLFTTKDINKISARTTFNIEDFRQEESILYIIYPERKSNYLSPFIAPLFSQIIDKLIDNFNDKSLPIHLLFDEFGNIGMLSNMSINSATVRSRKINITACIQSITQLYQVYGVYNSKSILNNLKTKIVLPGVSDVDTINYISGLCGVGEISVKSISKSGSNNNTTISKTKRKLFEDGELRTLSDNNGLLVINNKMPIIDEIELYFKTDRLDNVIEQVPYNKVTSIFVDIPKEIERIKTLSVENNSVKEELNVKARTITSRIFGREE